MTATAPYGSWTSPITAGELAESGHPVAGGTWVGDEVWWLELRPSEAGRYLVRALRDGVPVDILPAPFNARTRVHEYGGGAWTVTDAAVLVFAEFTDQRLYRLDAGSSSPLPLTPEGFGFRFADLSVRGDEVVAVRETHTGDDVERDIVAVPLDGSASAEAGGIRSIVAGSHFLANPRFSPDGRRLAWIAWEHPQMPWDGTELRVGDVGDGVVGEWTALVGSETRSVLQPEWTSNDSLLAIDDESGWWNLTRVGLDGSVTPVLDDAAEYGGALWSLGMRWFDLLDDGRVLVVRTLGEDDLVVVDPASGTSAGIDLPLTSIALGARRGTEVCLVGGSSTIPTALWVLDLDTGGLEQVRASVDALPDAAVLPIAEQRTFGGERDVHAIVYPPRNDAFAAPDGELPPFVAFVHGGPTSRVSTALDLTVAYFTSRGIGVAAVNYGGSTGYGREYRERLRGQWGIVDVEDVITVMLGLAEAGLADRDRLGIRGGSAGGWTVLAALTGSDVFAAGTSYYGVAELTRFARDTHDFESRYLDGLVGPLPEAQHLYDSRAPLNRIDALSTPVLLLQGLDDEVVPPSQAEIFRDGLVAKHLPHAYIAYEGESHGFRRASTIVDATESELSFYGQVMGFEPAGVPPLDLMR